MATDFRHEALFYAGDGGFLEGTLPFIRAGTEAREPMLVAVDTRKIGLLREHLNGAADGVCFVDMAELGRNPGRIISAWYDFLDERGGSARPVRGIGEPIWSGRREDETVEAQHHEALLNEAFADAPAFRLMCPYDMEGLGPDVLAAAERTHPWLVRDGAELPSSSFCRDRSCLSTAQSPLAEPGGEVRAVAFQGRALQGVRALVAEAAAAAGLSDLRAVDLALAVSEIATNSVIHGGGEGVLRVWREDGALVAEVRDAGRIEDPLVGRRRAVRGTGSGRGLWIVHQVCDLVQIRSSDEGTTVRLRMDAEG